MAGPPYRTSASRWTSILIYAIVGAFLIPIALPWGWNHARSYVLQSWVNPWAFRVSVWLGCVTLAYAAARVVPVRPSQLRLAHMYPPLWLSIALAGVLAWTAHVLGAMRFPTFVSAAVGPSVMAELAISLAVGAWLQSRTEPRSRRRQPDIYEAATATDIVNWSAVEQWVQAEEPSRYDLLHARSIAKRLARLIASESGDQPFSVAVVGAWGSGKTTVLRWAERCWADADSPTSMWCCWISLWGIDDSKLLATHILHSVVREVERHLDVGGIRGLPESYLRILQATPFNALELLLRADHGPDVLGRLDDLEPLLRLAGARLVVIVEDADRATTKDFDPRHLERVLDRLRHVPRVSCVLALDQGRANVDLLKLCEHIELLPQLDVDRVRRVLSVVRQHCLKDFNFIRPPAEREARDRLDLNVTEDGGLLDYVRRHYDRNVCDTITDLTSTPRILKHVVRRVVRVWGALHGEVDIDDVIAISVLKEGCPQGLAFLTEHIDALRETPDQFNRRPAESKEAWARLVESDSQAALAAPLVRALGIRQLSDGPTGLIQVPQGVNRAEPTDYFRRILAEEVPSDEVTDQQVLRDISAWLAGSESVMIDRLLAASDDNKRYVQVWEEFAGLVPDGECPNCVEQVFKAILAQVEVSGVWSRHRALSAMWREQHRRGRPAMVKPTQLSAMMLAAVPHSLELVNDLYYFWATCQPQYGVFTADERSEVRRAMVSGARAILSSAAVLCTATRGASEAFALRGLVMPVDQNEPASILRDPLEWRWMGPMVAECLRLEPSVMERQVAALIGNVRERVTIGDLNRDYVIDRPLAEGFFGADLGDVLQRLAARALTGEFWADSAAREAQRWLAEGLVDAPSKASPDLGS